LASTLLGRNWSFALGIRLPEGQEAALHGAQDISSLLTEFQDCSCQGWAHLQRCQQPRDKHAYPEVISRPAVSRPSSQDLVLSQVVNSVSRGEKLVQQPYSHKANALSLERAAYMLFRVVIPQSLKSRVLQRLHAMHRGMKKTDSGPALQFGGPGLNQDIAHTAPQSKLNVVFQRWRK
ncbi:hypothetical protein MRX96_052909, partial [Rhipicephalus microplus]